MIHRLRVDILPQLHVLMRNLKPMLRFSMLTALRTERVDRPCEVHLTLADEILAQLLNRDKRGIDRVTDVLSFPLQKQTPGSPLIFGTDDINPKTGRLMLGDIVLCLPQAQRQAKEYGHTLERELSFLTVHSMLHLLGYDHERDPGAKLMRGREKAVMEAIKQG
ncbi:MAG: rRNA maturation RNase YbeY [Oscillospiraceae bacterium]|nr:rRNA maturation RNase YbeY [Oscillospiraceae bacterium]